MYIMHMHAISGNSDITHTHTHTYRMRFREVKQLTKSHTVIR